MPADEQAVAEHVPDKESIDRQRVPFKMLDRTMTPYVENISGVVTWLSRTTEETDSWLHVDWAGGQPSARSRILSSLRHSLRSNSAGKGSTREQSRVSAL